MIDINCKKCGRLLARVEYGEGEIMCKNCHRITKYKVIMQSGKELSFVVKYN